MSDLWARDHKTIDQVVVRGPCCVCGEIAGSEECVRACNRIESGRKAASTRTEIYGTSAVTKSESERMANGFRMISDDEYVDWWETR